MNAKLFLLIAVIFLTGCSVEMLQSGNSITGGVVADGSSKKQFTIYFEDGRYSPDTIVVNRGDLVLIEFYDRTNSTDVFVIENYDAESAVKEGRTELFLKAYDSGTFEYGLRKEISKGKLIVK